MSYCKYWIVSRVHLTRSVSNRPMRTWLPSIRYQEVILSYCSRYLVDRGSRIGVIITMLKYTLIWPLTHDSVFIVILLIHSIPQSVWCRGWRKFLRLKEKINSIYCTGVRTPLFITDNCRLIYEWPTFL